MSWLSGINKCVTVYHGGGTRNHGKQGQKGLLCEEGTDVSDAQSRADEQWSVRGHKKQAIDLAKNLFVQKQVH